MCFVFSHFPKGKKCDLKNKVEEGPKTQLKKYGISQTPKFKIIIIIIIIIIKKTTPTRVQSYEL